MTAQGDKGTAQRGDHVIPSREQFNTMMRAGNAHARQLGERPQSPADLTPSQTIVYVKNNSGSDVARFGVLGIGTVQITPTDRLASFQHLPILDGESPTTADHTGKFVVTLEPIANGKIGRAVIDGLVQAQVDSADDAMAFADVTASDLTKLTGRCAGGAQIIYRESGTGAKWALVRIGKAWSGPFPITLSQTGGSAGSASAACSFTYTVTDSLTGVVLGTNVNVTASPHLHNRPSLGAQIAADGGLAYYNSSGQLVILWVNEQDDAEACA